MFRYITYPLLTPIIAVVMTFSVLFTFTDFQLIWVMTRGGPVNATHLMATLSYQRAILGGLSRRRRRDLDRDDPVPAGRDPDLVVRPAAPQMAAGRRAMTDALVAQGGRSEGACCAAPSPLPITPRA